MFTDVAVLGRSVKKRVIITSIKFYKDTFKFELIIIGQDWYYQFSFFSSESG